MQGLSLRNVAIQVRNSKEDRLRRAGELLFTHFGLSAADSQRQRTYAGL